MLSSESGKLDMLDSGIPSDMLEQEAQMFGFRERVLPFSAIGSPQHLQIRRLILLWHACFCRSSSSYAVGWLLSMGCSPHASEVVALSGAATQ